MAWTLDAFAACSLVDGVVLVAHPADRGRIVALAEPILGPRLVAVVDGGEDRQATVRSGLDACADAEFVVVHDGARPCVTADWIRDVTMAAFAGAAATGAVPVNDTLVRGQGEPGSTLRMTEGVSRDGLWAVQTPQAFRRDLLLRAHLAAEAEGHRATDDAGLVRRLGRSVSLVPLTAANVKVTRREDVAVAESILEKRGAARPEGSEGMVADEVRVGFGYDVHRFAAGRALWLGGVHFPEADRGLDGHSDADVALHAVCDALLGAAGLGDIGHWFPPSDPVHAGRASIEFVREVAQRIGDLGWRIGNVDLTLVAEAPKVAPQADVMRQTIAAGLGIAPEQVGIKATTNEGMGFVGRAEGIAAHAVALVSRPKLADRRSESGG